MHAAIYVIGPDPMERVKRTRLGFDSNPPDWCGIGGRYTGGLIPLPGATGVAYGDTLPQLEAGLLAVMADPRTAAAGPGAQQGPGVDQIARRDLDIDASRSPGYVLDADDRLHGPGYAAEEAAFILADRMGLDIAPSEALVQSVCRKAEAWYGVIVGDRVEGAFISIVRRRGDHSIAVSPAALHAQIAAGRALLRGTAPR